MSISSFLVADSVCAEGKVWKEGAGPWVLNSYVTGKRGGEKGKLKRPEGHSKKSQIGEKPQKEGAYAKDQVMEFRKNSVCGIGMLLLLILVGIDVQSTAVQVRHTHTQSVR